MQQRESTHPWTVTTPAEWPAAPAVFSFSQVADIEFCPLRWGLRRGCYPDIWQRNGYPRPFQLGAFSGTVLHLSLERIGKAAVEEHQLSQGHITAALKKLGGLSAIVRDAADRVIRSEYEANPRIRSVSAIREYTERQLPSLRERLQFLISSLQTSQSGIVVAKGVSSGSCERGPLLNGSHFEVDLHSEFLRWKGRADLINISEDHIEIVDFKTGEPKEQDKTQLEIYAVLWSHDKKVNPDGRIATRLRLVYPTHDVVSQAPPESRLRPLSDELKQRGDRALSCLKSIPPEAHLNSECSTCDVRHLCASYWAGEFKITQKPQNNKAIDVQISVASRVGQNNWEVKIEASNAPAAPKALLRNSTADPIISQIIESASSVRVLNAYWFSPDDTDSQLPLLALNDRSEVFSV